MLLKQTMSLKCTNHCKIAFGHLRLSLNVINKINTVLMCKIVANNNMLVDWCALMHKSFGNGECVRLLEHVRLLEGIRYITSLMKNKTSIQF